MHGFCPPRGKQRCRVKLWTVSFSVLSSTVIVTEHSPPELSRFSWAENCFGFDRMSFNGGNRLTEVNIAALEDIGYTVSYDTADGYGGFGSGCCNRRLRGAGRNATISEWDNDEEHPTKSGRQLSEQGRQKAQDFGKGILRQRQQSHGRLPYGARVDYDDIGSHLLMVMYEEEGEIYNVKVML